MRNIKQTVLLIGCTLLGVMGLLSLQTTTASAQAKCGGVDTSLISCPQPGGEDAAVEDTGIWGLLVVTINILVALVSVVALGGIVYGAILYTSAGGNMEQTKKGMQIIANVAIGIIAFALMYVGLNFLIPGGVFNP